MFILFQSQLWDLCFYKIWLSLLQEHHVKEKEEQPTMMNAFELISMSKGLDLGNLFDVEQVLIWNSFRWCCITFIQLMTISYFWCIWKLIKPYVVWSNLHCIKLPTFTCTRHFDLNCSFTLLQEFKRETRFSSTCPANEIISKIEEAAKPLGFDVQKKNYKVLYIALNLKLHTCIFYMNLLEPMFITEEIWPWNFRILPFFLLFRWSWRMQKPGGKEISKLLPRYNHHNEYEFSFHLFLPKNIQILFVNCVLWKFRYFKWLHHSIW